MLFYIAVVGKCEFVFNEEVEVLGEVLGCGFKLI